MLFLNLTNVWFSLLQRKLLYSVLKSKSQKSKYWVSIHTIITIAFQTKIKDTAPGLFSWMKYPKNIMCNLVLCCPHVDLFSIVSIVTLYNFTSVLRNINKLYYHKWMLSGHIITASSLSGWGGRHVRLELQLSSSIELYNKNWIRWVRWGQCCYRPWLLEELLIHWAFLSFSLNTTELRILLVVIIYKYLLRKCTNKNKHHIPSVRYVHLFQESEPLR